MTPVYAVVVARASAGAKSRLASVLSDAQRRELVLAMLADVLDVCRTAPEVEGVILVSDTVFEGGPGVVHVDDPGSDMNAAVAAGLEVACERGARTAIVLPADIPLLSHRDLTVLLATAASEARAVVIGASRNGEGTNALLVRPPDAIRPAFGPPSVQRHRHLAETAHCHTVLLPDLALALDVDTPEDLALLRSTPHLPPHTEHFLSSTPN